MRQDQQNIFTKYITQASRQEQVFIGYFRVKDEANRTITVVIKQDRSSLTGLCSTTKVQTKSHANKMTTVDNHLKLYDCGSATIVCLANDVRRLRVTGRRNDIRQLPANDELCATRVESSLQERGDKCSSQKSPMPKCPTTRRTRKRKCTLPYTIMSQSGSSRVKPIISSLLLLLLIDTIGSQQRILFASASGSISSTSLPSSSSAIQSKYTFRFQCLNENDKNRCD